MSRPRRAGLAFLLALSSTWIFAPSSRAQLADNLSALFEPANAAAYVDPLREALAAGLGTGLAPSGSVASGKQWHLRLGMQALRLGVDEDARTYRATLPASFPSSGNVVAPTIIGDPRGANFAASGADSFTTIGFPGGFDLDRVALAIPQLSASAFGFEATLRWASIDRGTTELGDIRLLGLGGRYDITRWLGTGLPVNVSASIFHQSLEMGDGVIDASMLSYGVHVSRSFGRLVPYTAVAFDSFDFDLVYMDARGEEITIGYDRDQRPRISLGAAVHLPFVHVNTELNFSEQFSTGIGLSIGQ